MLGGLVDSQMDLLRKSVLLLLTTKFFLVDWLKLLVSLI